MKTESEPCRYEMAYAVQFQHLRDDLGEVKDRVMRLELTLGRGVLLLLANLAGMVMMLIQRIVMH